MSGYNHYINCMCPWCVKATFYRRDTESIRSYLDIDTAKRQLDKLGARHKWSICFVNPNASCPVCHQKVFYYENANGSKVFFDELGPPWPKHPCTDNKSITDNHPPVRFRPRGEIDEILECREIVLEFFDEAFNNNEWVLIEIVSISRNGYLNKIHAKAQTESTAKEIYFTYTSDEQNISVGQIISWKDEEISLPTWRNRNNRKYKIVLYPNNEFTD